MTWYARDIWILSIIWIHSFEVCPGRERIGGFGCYDVIRIPGGANWYQANEHCTDIGKVLLAIESEEENTAVKNYLKQKEGKQIDILRAH